MKEHSETIVLTKNKSLFENVDIEYNVVTDEKTLMTYIQVMLNNKQLGTINPGNKEYYAFRFNATSGLIESFTGKTLEVLKQELEQKVRSIIHLVKTWHE